MCACRVTPSGHFIVSLLEVEASATAPEFVLYTHDFDVNQV